MLIAENSFWGRDDFMQNTVKKDYSFMRFCIATVLCFISVYLSEVTLGAVATIPFMLVFPGIAYLIYRKKWHIAGLCVLASLIFKAVFSDSIYDILFYTVMNLGYCAISLMIAKIPEYKKKDNFIKSVCIALFYLILGLGTYITFYGTFFGNISSNKVNTEYLEATYPDEQFLIGNTYYSFPDRYYVTEFGFTARERYTALVSAEDKFIDGFAEIDGYRDFMKSEIMDVGINNIRMALSSFAYEGSDFAVRKHYLNTTDLLTSDVSYRDYLGFANYEIALYYQFDSKEAFEDMCSNYIEHLEKYDNVVYGAITFYGFDMSGKDVFAFTSRYSSDYGEFKTEAFDKDKYSRYFSEEDTHRYWELRG